MTQAASLQANDVPHVRFVGVDGLLITFSETLTEPANRAALAFCAAVERAGWAWISETTTSLVSTFVKWDPAAVDEDQALSQVKVLLQDQDWYAAPLPKGRRLWRIPATFGTTLAPQLDEAAEAAGLSAQDAIQMVCARPLKVQTIGFAPGQPYLGVLAECWDIPRRTSLNKGVPAGALVAAIRQLTLYSQAAPTGWHHIAQTAAKLFCPDAQEPFLLRPGDEVLFTPVSPAELQNIAATGGRGAERGTLK